MAGQCAYRFGIAAASLSQQRRNRGSVRGNVASGGHVKVNGSTKGLHAVFPETGFDLHACPVELQDRPHMQVRALPHEEDETTEYARLRLAAMKAEYGVADINIAIESGTFNGTNGLYDAVDVAVIIIETADGRQLKFNSAPIAYPTVIDAAGVVRYPAVEAAHRGFKTTTPGDVIHELLPHIPANNWQAHFPGPNGPPLSRDDQIAQAFIENQDALRTLLGPVIEPSQHQLPSAAGDTTLSQ